MQGIQGNCQNVAAPWTGRDLETGLTIGKKHQHADRTSVSTSQGVELDLTTKEGG